MAEVIALFLRTGVTGAPLAEVARSVFDALKISDREERFSSHYPPNDHYFMAYAQNAAVQVSDADYLPFLDYKFFCSVEAPRARRVGSEVIAMNAEAIGRAIASTGIRVFIPEGDWTATEWDGQGIVCAV